MFWQLVLSIDPATEALQSKLIHDVFRDFDKELRDAIHISSPPQDITFNKRISHRTQKKCTLSFTDRALEALAMPRWDCRMHPGDLHIEFLPQSVQFLEVVNCKQRFMLQLRWMPRECRFLNLCDNLIRGKIALQELPPYIVHVELSKNYLTGRILFVNLPKTLKKLLLQNNFDLGKPRAFYGDLPESIEEINVRNTQIRQLDPLWGKRTRHVPSVLLFDRNS